MVRSNARTGARRRHGGFGDRLYGVPAGSAIFDLDLRLAGCVRDFGRTCPTGPRSADMALPLRTGCAAHTLRTSRNEIWTGAQFRILGNHWRLAAVFVRDERIEHTLGGPAHRPRANAWFGRNRAFCCWFGHAREQTF